MSATPADYELMKSEGVIVEQLIRPTGLVDPPLEVRITDNQIDDLLEEIDKRVRNDDKILVTTITKRMAEELSKYFDRVGVRNRYIHSDIDTLERVQILEDLRAGMFDVLIGVNLLREGLDLPEVALVAILDADKEGFLRNVRSITQIAGRAARHSNGNVILYADHCTDSMRYAIEQSNRRREKQMRYNMEHEMLPRQAQKSGSGQSTLLANTVQTPVTDGIIYPLPDNRQTLAADVTSAYSTESIDTQIARAREEMERAAKSLDFLAAAKFRDRMYELQKLKNENEHISIHLGTEQTIRLWKCNGTQLSSRIEVAVGNNCCPTSRSSMNPSARPVVHRTISYCENDIPVAFIEAKDFTQTQRPCGTKRRTRSNSTVINIRSITLFSPIISISGFTRRANLWTAFVWPKSKEAKSSPWKAPKRNSFSSSNAWAKRPAKNHVCETIGPNHGGKSETDGRRHRKGAAARR